MEKEAYGEELQNSHYFFDAKKDRLFIEDLQGKYEIRRDSVEREDKELQTISGKLKHLLAPTKRPDFLESRIHNPAELETLRRQVEDIDTVVYKELETVRKNREQVLDPDQAQSRFRRRLEDLSEKYCKDPGLALSSSLEEMKSIADVRPSNCITFLPAGYMNTNCPRSLYKALCENLAAGENLSPIEIAAKAASRKSIQDAQHYRGLLNGFARRSCDAPGSVSQEDLEQLKGFYDAVGLIHRSPMPPFTNENLCFNSVFDAMLRDVRNHEIPSAGMIETIGSSYKPRPQVPPMPRPPLFASAVSYLARAACANPSVVTEEYLKGILFDSFGNPLVIGEEEERASLSGCARDLYDELMVANGQIRPGYLLNEVWVKDKANELSRKHQPPVQSQPQYKEPPQRPDRGQRGCLPPDRNTGIIGCPADQPR